MKLTPDNARIGDGATVLRYSDREAVTIVAKTATTVTLQRDKATLLTKMEFVPGGFAAHCPNNDSQEYTYESNPAGEKVVAHWSKKREAFLVSGHDAVVCGRSKKYDFNF